jgi:hypothetical protein
VRYVHWRRRSRRNSLSKMEYKNSREKITQNPKPQYTQISLSHNRDYSQKKIQKKRQEYKLIFCWDKMAAGLSIFLSHKVAASFFLLFWLLQNQEERRRQLLFLLHPLLKLYKTCFCAALIFVKQKDRNSCPFISQSRSTKPKQVGLQTPTTSGSLRQESQEQIKKEGQNSWAHQLDGFKSPTSTISTLT